MANILNDIAVVDYVPFDSTTIGNPALDPMDVIRFSGGHADETKVSCITSITYASYGNRSTIGYFIMSNYLATINNLSEPVTKTADKTMKVTYIIQEQYAFYSCKHGGRRIGIHITKFQIVKRIYREYLEGKSLMQIARGLMADGIHTAADKPTWRPEGVRKILTNEKYMGDALLQKTYTVDVLTKKRVTNNGIVPQYYVENNHEAIIPRDLFMQVQEELVRRANLRTNKDGTKRVYSSKYALSSRLYCGKCGDTMRRIAEQSHGKKYPKWKCATRVNKGPSGCDGDAITEREIHNAVVRAINKTLGGREDMLEKLKQNVEETFMEQSESVYEEIDAELVKLQEQLLQRVNANQDYEDIAVEIERLRDKKQSLSVEDSEREGLKTRIQEMREFLEQQTTRVDEYDEQLVIRLIEKIKAYDDKFVFQFKSGMTLELKR